MLTTKDVLPTFSQVWPGFRNQVTTRADEWIDDRGNFLPYIWMRILCENVSSSLRAGSVEHIDEIFRAAEKFLDEGDSDSASLIATGFLEGLQHDKKLAANDWVPFLGPRSAEHCKAMDKFYGITGHESKNT